MGERLRKPIHNPFNSLQATPATKGKAEKETKATPAKTAEKKKGAKATPVAKGKAASAEKLANKKRKADAEEAKPAKVTVLSTPKAKVLLVLTSCREDRSYVIQTPKHHDYKPSPGDFLSILFC